MAKDLAMITHLFRLKTVAAPEVLGNKHNASINALAEKFVAGLQSASPSSVHTILATACKLQVRANPSSARDPNKRISFAVSCALLVGKRNPILGISAKVQYSKYFELPWLLHLLQY